MKKTALHLALLPNVFTALFAFGFPLNAGALGLGEMRVQSALDQPFLAEITLVDAPDSAATSLKVNLASPQTFEHLGIPVADVLSRLLFDIKRNKQGRFVIHIHSKERMSEPYMQMVVDVTWPKGQLYKAYTVLLDPPGYKLDLEPTSNKDAPRKHVMRRVVVPKQQVASSPVTVDQNTYGPTVASENVWQIAQRYKTEESILPQVVLAIVGKNPEAFNDGNLNGLKSGEQLKVPNHAEIMKVPADLATVEVMAHDKAWNEKTPIDHVLAPPYTNGQTPGPNTTAEYSKVPPIPKITPNLATLPQLIPQNMMAPVSALKPEAEHDVTLKAELSITTAAIETLRESNAILIEQLHLAQKDNKKLAGQLAQRDRDIQLIHNQIQALEKERQTLVEQINAHKASSSSFSLWPFLALLGLAGGAFWHFKRRKPIETEIPESNPPEPEKIIPLMEPVITPIVEPVSEKEPEIIPDTHEEPAEASPEVHYEQEEFTKEEPSTESPQDNLLEFEPGLHQLITEEPQTHDTPAEENTKDESNSLDFTGALMEEPEVKNTVEVIEDDSSQALDTLLDLAKTYVGMGDIESALSSLNEVLEQGTDAQKEKAQEMINQLK